MEHKRDKYVENGNRLPILILANHDIVVYNFRLELIERLLMNGYDVHISCPYGERVNDLTRLGVVYHKIIIERHGMNPIAEIILLEEYRKLVLDVNPIIIFSYTIKPNIYGAIAAKNAHIPMVANITGLGLAIGKNWLRQQLFILLYKYAFTDVQRVFFQNIENARFFEKNKIALGKHTLLPGSGVNLERYPCKPYPVCGDGKTGKAIKFAFLARIMKEKGIDDFLAAAKEVKQRYPCTEFHVCGFCESGYEDKVDELNQSKVIIYHGMIRNVAEFMSEMHCIVHPTYYPEGLSNVLLEACSVGRIIITTDRPGCREVVCDGVNGYMVPERDSKALINAIEKIIQLSWSSKASMGMNARRFVEKKYDRNIVVDEYMKEINELQKNFKK